MWEDGYGINGMHSILDERCVVWSKGAHEQEAFFIDFDKHVQGKNSLCDNVIVFHIRLWCEVCIIGGMFDCNFRCASYVTPLQCVIKKTWRWQGNDENFRDFHNPCENLGMWRDQGFWNFKGMEWHYLVKVAIVVDEWLNN